MNDWLQRKWKKSKHPFVKAIALFILVFLAILGGISLISDTGFAREVQENRVLLWLITAAMASVAALGWLIHHISRELSDSKNLIDQLRDENSNFKNQLERVEQERESAFELMKPYKAQTQEEIINELEQLAQFAIMREQWRKKEAKVDRLRSEESVTNGDEDMIGADQRVIVIINLGEQDRVMKHMRFVVQDPTDSHEYGVLEVQELYRNGAKCTILQISDMAFWSDVVQAAREGRPFVSDTPAANVIVPQTPLREISPESAEELLSWLQNIRRAEL
jgi:ribosomal protein L9